MNSHALKLNKSKKRKAPEPELEPTPDNASSDNSDDETSSHNSSGSGSEIIASNNPYLTEIENLKSTIPEWDTFFQSPREVQGNNWIRLEILGQSLCSKYSWAIPDDRALRICAQFSPLVEIGAGLGYWAKLLRDRGVDIIALDKYVQSATESACWTDVDKGGPKALQRSSVKGRNLFLCYPDEGESMAVKCLEFFTGDYIIHVGELSNTGTLSGGSQAPFGRTSSSDFNVSLMEEFHCLLKAKIPRFPFSNDCISVWKRTQFVQGKSILDSMEGGSGAASEDDDDDDDDERAVTGKDDISSNEGGKDAGGEEDLWASIPQEERLPSDSAAPCLAHLL